MTQRIGAQAAEIFAAVDALSELELQFAKARFAEDYNCVEVKLTNRERTAASPVQSRVGTDAFVVPRWSERSVPEAESREPKVGILLLHNARHPCSSAISKRKASPSFLSLSNSKETAAS